MKMSFVVVQQMTLLDGFLSEALYNLLYHIWLEVKLEISLWEVSSFAISQSFFFGPWRFTVLRKAS